MKLYERRPAFYAAQFTGLNFIGEAELFAAIEGYTIQKAGRQRTVSLVLTNPRSTSNETQSLTLNEGDWLLVDELGAYSVATHDEIRRRFEQVGA